MSNIQPLTSDVAGPAGELLDSIKKKLGVVPNIFATFAHSPAVLEGYLAFSEALAGGVLPASLREQIAIAVAGENSCDYCASAHTALARGAGVSAEEAALNLEGKASDSRVAKILAFARSMVEKRGRLDESELAQLRSAGVSDEELVEILAHVGLNLFTNYFNHIADTEVDFPLIHTGDKRYAA
ncbi:MAG: carboxymuconolactone decarboxylase family protein [Wenzhouxiangellaceae bacterium]